MVMSYKTYVRKKLECEGKCFTCFRVLPNEDFRINNECIWCNAEYHIISKGRKMINILEKPDDKKAWLQIEDTFLIKNEKDYKKAIKVLDKLIDTVAPDDQKHELFGFMEVLGIIIENYESEHEPL